MTSANDQTEDLSLVTGEPARLLLDVGEHPVAHKFVSQKGEVEESFPIQLGIGEQSGLVGLINPPAWQALTPIYPWIVCNEPEDHLDELAQVLNEKLAEKLVKTTDSPKQLLGLSYKDDTLLERLNKLGVGDISQFQHAKLQQVVKPGVEVVQAVISEADFAENQSAKGQYDLILGRHILEHTWDTRAFLNNVLSLLSDDGLLMLEVPANEKAFQNAQHTVIWEEHSLYFTEHTLKGLMQEYGLSIESFIRYPMALEDVLVVLVRKGPSSTQDVPEQDSQEEKWVEHFQQSFEPSRLFFQEKLAGYRAQYGKVAILGAGHLGAAFVNFYQLGNLIDAVIDDDPNKQGMYMPGCQLPIIGSKALNDGEYSLCLLTCNPWNNEKIALRNQDFINKGGVFLSVFQPEKWS